LGPSFGRGETARRGGELEPRWFDRDDLFLLRFGEFLLFASSEFGGWEGVGSVERRFFDVVLLRLGRSEIRGFFAALRGTIQNRSRSLTALGMTNGC
jgi:hypothetical protein